MLERAAQHPHTHVSVCVSPCKRVHSATALDVQWAAVAIAAMASVLLPLLLLLPPPSGSWRDAAPVRHRAVLLPLAHGCVAIVPLLEQLQQLHVRLDLVVYNVLPVALVYRLQVVPVCVRAHTQGKPDAQPNAAWPASSWAHAYKALHAPLTDWQNGR